MNAPLIDTPDAATHGALAALLEDLGLAGACAGARLRITGADSPRVSTLRIGSANAVAMLAAGAGVAAHGDEIDRRLPRAVPGED